MTVEEVLKNPKFQMGALAVIVVVVIIVLCVTLIPKHKTIEQYINEAKDALNALTSNNKSFANFATDYVNKRSGTESNVQAQLSNSNTALAAITNARILCETNANQINTNLGIITSAASNAVNNASTAQTAVIDIQNIVNEVSQTPSGTPVPAKKFGDVLASIASAKTSVETNYSGMLALVQVVEGKYTEASNNQQAIANNYNTANTELATLKTFIESLVSGINNSNEYIALRNARDKAQTLNNQLEIIIQSFTTTTDYTRQIMNLRTSLGSAIASADIYLKNVTDVFTLLTTSSAYDTINSAIVSIIANYNNAVAIVGKNVSSPFLTTASNVSTTAVPNGRTIVYLYNTSHADYQNLVNKYILFINSFNSVTTSLNSLTDFGNNNVLNGVNTNINTVNYELNQAVATLKQYFPGGTTPPPPAAYTNQVGPVPLTTIQPIAPYTYTTIPPPY